MKELWIGFESEGYTHWEYLRVTPPHFPLGDKFWAFCNGAAVRIDRPVLSICVDSL